MNGELDYIISKISDKKENYNIIGMNIILDLLSNEFKEDFRKQAIFVTLYLFITKIKLVSVYEIKSFVHKYYGPNEITTVQYIIDQVLHPLHFFTHQNERLNDEDSEYLYVNIFGNSRRIFMYGFVSLDFRYLYTNNNQLMSLQQNSVFMEENTKLHTKIQSIFLMIKILINQVTRPTTPSCTNLTFKRNLKRLMISNVRYNNSMTIYDSDPDATEDEEDEEVEHFSSYKKQRTV